jgi:hypothetical protein
MWIATAEHAVIALAVGQHEAAEARIEEALALGERSQPDMAVPAYHQQRHGLLELTGSLTDAEAGIAQLVAASPRPLFRCHLAHVYAATKRPNDAAREIQVLMRDELPFDAGWPLAISLLAEAHLVAFTLHDHGRMLLRRASARRRAHRRRARSLRAALDRGRVRLTARRAMRPTTGGRTAAATVAA